jgi:hypothetical protein
MKMLALFEKVGALLKDCVLWKNQRFKNMSAPYDKVGSL